jgi:pimeloyl-ACP methyl ester carboxylesterase
VKKMQKVISKKVTSKDGTTIAFDRYGEGPAVILVGGAFQHRAIDQKLAQLATFLAQNFTVYHYDRRGRGDSSDTAPYAVKREVEDIESLMDEAGGSAFLFGMSSGGVLILEAAVRGIDIKKLALYEPPFNLDDNTRPAFENYNQQLNALLAENHPGAAAALAMMMFGTPAESVDEMRQTPVWSIFESVAPTLAYDAAIMGDGSLPAERMNSITIPTMVIDGGASPDWVHYAALALVDAIPNAESHTLEGQTHDVNPGAIAPILVEFFSD